MEKRRTLGMMAMAMGAAMIDAIKEPRNRDGLNSYDAETRKQIQLNARFEPRIKAELTLKQEKARAKSKRARAARKSYIH